MELQQVYKLNDVLKNKDSSDFVTVVSVVPIEKSIDSNQLSSEYVTVLKIGEIQNESCTSADDAEEVSVYRLPGERLGFGLKFEGGTKASEYVKRLFIQSCAPDSPASRVRSSWGCLREGDEVIEIDSVPVQTMTRIDCVRCLKDSNVVIKLFVKRNNFNDVSDNSDSSDHLPLVISAEKKRTPPPPPPVPPRKISRKTINVANKTITRISHENDEPATVSVQRKTQADSKLRLDPSNSTNNKKPVLSSYQQSTEAIQRDQRILMEHMTGPPDAEIYIDLLSQESTYYMSESDDTGSSISTIVDRFSSFPTTTCSSVCSSLPTTPTSIQKQIDLTNIHNLCEDDETCENSTQINNELFDQLNFAPNDIELSGQSEFLYASLEKLTTTPLQPPTNFQDAPLSYGDEEIKLIITPIQAAKHLESGENKIVEQSVVQPPPPPPRSKQLLIKKEQNNNNTKQEKLPRLVDYLPKFLHNESDLPLKVETPLADMAQPIQLKYCNPKENLTGCIGMWDEDKSHPFQLKNSQLATIGEDEEFTQDKNITRYNTSSPAVVINDEKCSKPQCYDSPSDLVDENIMEVPPINLRQPPDGHELLNYKELPIPSKHQNNVQSIIAKFSTSVDYNVTGENANTTNNTSNVLERSVQISKEEVLVLSDSSLTSHCEGSQNAMNAPSQTTIEYQRWHTVGEQQTKRLSKLKGLIIPEQSVIEDIAIVDLPEIKTISTKMIPLIETKHIHDNYQIANNSKNSLTPSLTTPIWNTDNFNTIPKYSPAFKRKHLQIFGKSDSAKTIASPPIKQYTSSSVSPVENNFLGSPSKITAKSLESVVVPEQDKNENIRTDQSNPKDEKYNNSFQSSYTLNNDYPHTSELHSLRQEERKSKHTQYNSEYESLTLNPRLLKPQSVEAINRKNILASAKCRSGQDLKIGSPLINRKSMDVVCDSKKNESQDVSIPPNNLSKLQSDIETKEFSDRNYNTAEKKKRDGKPKEVITTTVLNKNRSHLAKNTNPTRVVDILKNFEKNVSSLNTIHKINSTVHNLPKLVNIKESSSRTEQKANIYQNTINEKNISTISNNKDATQTIVLCPEVTGGSVGITLAGGTDYETKEITIHKVRCGSPAHRDGRLKKGDKILSINGKSMNGLTHGESISILKASGTTVTLVIGAADENETPITSINEAKSKPIAKTPKISPKQIDKVMVINERVGSQNEITIHLMKDSSGLGFSIEGGRDSSQGDLPLVVKKLFMGGAADRSKMLLVGDELININGSDVQGMARIDVWSLMKKLPDGEVVIKIRR